MLSTLTKRAGLLGLLLAGLLLSGCGESLNEATAALPSGRLIGYLPEYRLGSVDLERLARYYSDLIIFSVEPAKNGGIDMRRLPEARLKVVQQLKQAGVERVLLTVGGGGRSSGFAWACSSAGNRARLISRLRGICLQYGLDGVDYDWEAPRTAGQRAGYDALIIETKQAFATEGLYVTAAVMGSQKLSSAAIRAVDAIHIMAYDARGEHSSFSFATEAVQRWLAQGAAPQKLCLGVPFYGRAAGGRRRCLPYSRIAAAGGLDDDTDELNGICFNGISTLKQKTAYARSCGLGGVMVWEVGQDKPDCTLARAIRQELEAQR